MDKQCNVDELVNLKQHGNLVPVSEPMRQIKLSKEATVTPQPRRFYRTFWRGLAGRLKDFKSVQFTQAEEMEVPTHGKKKQTHDRRVCTLDTACRRMQLDGLLNSV